VSDVFSFTDPYSDPTPHLLAALVAPDDDVRLIAAQTVRKLPSAKAIPVLIERLTDEENDQVLAEVVETLGILRARDAAVPLLGLILHPDDLVRANVAEAFGWIGMRDPEITRALLKLLGDNEEVVRCYAAESLGDVGQGKEALEALQYHLEADDSLIVRIWCIYGCAGLGDEIDWDTFGEAFADADPIVRRQALLALRMLLNDNNSETATELVNAALLNETDDELRADYESFLRTIRMGERFP
jgi:HEAT repeat protein